MSNSESVIGVATITKTARIVMFHSSESVIGVMLITTAGLFGRCQIKEQ